MPTWKLIADIVLLGGVAWVVWGLNRAVKLGCSHSEVGNVENFIYVFRRVWQHLESDESAARVDHINSHRDSSGKGKLH